MNNEFRLYRIHLLQITMNPNVELHIHKRTDR